MYLSFRQFKGLSRAFSSTNAAVNNTYQKRITPALEVAPVALRSGSGSYVTDVEGKTYIDFNAGIAANSLGHCHPEMTRVVTEQMGKLIHMSRTYQIE